MPAAFVTGGGRGIGKAIALHFARAGFDVAISARTVTEGEHCLSGGVRCCWTSTWKRTSWRQHGGGTITTVSSGAGLHEPSAPAGKGGWGLGYGLSKATAYRIAGFLGLDSAIKGSVPTTSSRGSSPLSGWRWTWGLRDMGTSGLTLLLASLPTFLVPSRPGSSPIPRPPSRTVGRWMRRRLCVRLGLLAGWPRAIASAGSASPRGSGKHGLGTLCQQRYRYSMAIRCCSSEQWSGATSYRTTTRTRPRFMTRQWELSACPRR